MTFQINQCSALLAVSDPVIQINRAIAILVVTLEIICVLILRGCSALKNHDLESITNSKDALQTSNNHIDLEIIDIQSVKTDNLNHDNKQSKTLKQDSLFSHFVDHSNSSNKIITRGQKQLCKNQQQEISFPKNTTQSLCTSHAKQKKEEIKSQIEHTQKWFLNVFKLKLTFQDTVYYAHSLMGSTYICIAAAIAHFPYALTSFLCLLHFVIFISILTYHMCKKRKRSNSSSDIDAYSQFRKTNQTQANIMPRETKNQIQDKPLQQKKQFKDKVNLMFGILVAIINVFLLNLCVLGMKMTYCNKLEH